MLGTFFNGGVRAYDTSDPFRPREVAWYVPETPRGYCIRPEYVRDIQLLGQLGLTYDICIRPTELADAV